MVYSMNLPYELIENIYGYLDIKSTLMLLSTNKRLCSMKNIFFWTKRLKIDYGYVPTVSTKKPYTVQQKYTQCYNTMCIVCHNVTNYFHNFYNVKLCKKCELKIPKYKMICQSQIIKTKGLTLSNISNVPFITRYNNFNRSRPIKLFLESDIEKMHKQKFPGNSFQVYLKNKSDKKFNKVVMYTFKRTILASYLQTNLSIDIYVHDNCIMGYTNGLYSKYIKDIGKKINHTLLPKLINMYIELEFIRTQLFYQVYNTNIFYEVLEDVILLDNKTFPDELLSPYIQQKIVNVHRSDKYKRKQELIGYLEDTFQIDFYEPCVKEYIFYGTGTLYSVKLDIIERIFINEHIEFSSIMHNYLFSSKDKYQIMKERLLKLKNEGVIIPLFIEQRYSIAT